MCVTDKLFINAALLHFVYWAPGKCLLIPSKTRQHCAFEVCFGSKNYGIERWHYLKDVGGWFDVAKARRNGSCIIVCCGR